jgi:hypothetical protein
LEEPNTKTSKTKITAAIVAFLFTASIVSIAFVGSASASTTAGPATVVGQWHLDKIQSSGDTVVTPDAVSYNNGILGGEPEAALVDGKFDKALSFNGINFVYVPINFLVGFPPSAKPILIPINDALNIQTQIKIDAWINVQSFTNATYNTVLVKCTRTDSTWYSSSRVVGLAVRGLGNEDIASVQAGCLSGFVRTEDGTFNEIVTTQPITLNTWTHIAFDRTAKGMHLYVGGYEQSVNAIHGVQNPTGKIMNGTEIYFGHDANLTLDEVSLTDLAPEMENTILASIDIGPNLMIVVVAVATIFAVAWLLRRAIQMRVIHSRSS